MLQPGHTYYWWLDFARQDPGTPAPTSRVSGPFSFSLVSRRASAAGSGTTAVVKDPHAPVSTKTIAAAATLPSSTVFNGSRSVKHTTLTRLVYRTMKQLGYPAPARVCLLEPVRLALRPGGRGSRAPSGQLGAARILAWPATSLVAPGARDLHRRAGSALVQAAERPSGRGSQHGDPRDAARLRRRQRSADELHGRSAGAHVRLESRPELKRADYLGTLARNYVRKYAPPGYWNTARCRDGGPWDLLPSTRNLG